MTNKIMYLSKKGMKELKKAISQLEHDHHNTLREIREIDKVDGHDERLARIEKLANLEMIESELGEKRRTLANSKLLPRKRDLLMVAVGSVVDLIDTQGRLVRYTIVESFEANPSDGRISIESPLGKSLLGHKIQDVIEWSIGARTNQVRLIAIT